MEDISWQERVRMCEKYGYQRKHIARHCGIAYSTLCDIASGNTLQPRGYAAVLLYLLSESGRRRTAI